MNEQIKTALAELPESLTELLVASDEHLPDSADKLLGQIQGRRAYLLVGSFDRQQDIEVVRLIALHQLLRQQNKPDLMHTVETELLWASQGKFANHPGYNLVLCQNLIVVASLFRVVRGRIIWSNA